MNSSSLSKYFYDYFYRPKEELELWLAESDAIVTEYEHERATDAIISGGSLDDLDENESGL